MVWYTSCLKCSKRYWKVWEPLTIDQYSVKVFLLIGFSDCWFVQVKTIPTCARSSTPHNLMESWNSYCTINTPNMHSSRVFICCEEYIKVSLNYPLIHSPYNWSSNNMHLPPQSFMFAGMSRRVDKRSEQYITCTFNHDPTCNHLCTYQGWHSLNIIRPTNLDHSQWVTIIVMKIVLSWESGIKNTLKILPLHPSFQ